MNAVYTLVHRALPLAGVAGLTLALSACGHGDGYYDYGGGGSTAGTSYAIRDGNVGNIAAMATDTLLALGGPVRSLIDPYLPPLAQRPRQGLVPTLLDLSEQYMAVRTPVSSTTAGGLQVVSTAMTCSTGTGNIRSEFRSASAVTAGDSFTVTAQNCVNNGMQYNGTVSYVASVAGSGLPATSSLWSGTWTVSLSGWSQYDLINPPIGMRAQGSATLKAQRFAAGDAEATLTTVQAGSQTYGLNLSIVENSAIASQRDLSGVVGWRELSGSTYTSLDLTVAESFFVAQGLAALKVRTSGETLSVAGALPTGIWYAVASDNSIAYVTSRSTTPTQLLIEYGSALGRPVDASFASTWAELRNYL